MKKAYSQILELNKGEGLAITLYQPTTRRGQDVELGPIQFKNLMKEVEKRYEELDQVKEGRAVLEKLQEIQEDTDFWNHRTEGLAVFIRGDALITYNLTKDVPAKAYVKDTLHLLPLFTAEQALEQHFILEPSRDRYQLYFGNGSEVLPIEGKVALSFQELYDDLDANANVNFGSYTGSGNESGYHGHRAKPEMEEKDKEKYFRYLDDTLGEFFDRYNFKVIVGGTKENVSQWMREVDEPFYIEEDLGKPVRDFDEEELLMRVQEIFSNLENTSISAQLDSVRAGINSGRASTHREEIKGAIEQARVETLFIRDSYREEQVIEIDRMVRDAINSGADVVVVPSHMQDVGANIAATFRY